MASRSIAEMPDRGFPPGYIAALEKRLLETELALFETVATLAQMPTLEQVSTTQTPTVSNEHFAEILASRSSHQAKASSLREWSRLPLKVEAQRRIWLQTKRPEFATAANTDTTTIASSADAQDRNHQIESTATSSTAENTRAQQVASAQWRRYF
jgi:hypothetical protein